MNGVAVVWLALGFVGVVLMGMFFLLIRIDRGHDRLNRRMDLMAESSSVRLDRINTRIDNLRHRQS